MSDPLERLRASGGPAGDPAAIRRRAAQLAARRRWGLTGAATLVAALVVVGAVRPWEPGEVDRLAQTGSQPTATAQPLIEVGPEEEEAEDAYAAPALATAAPLAADGAPRTTAGGASAPAWGPMPTASSEGGLVVELLVERKSVPEGEPVRMTLRACNRGSEPVEVPFNDGQDYDFEAWEPGKSEPSWRWVDGGYGFTQAVREERFAAGECRTYPETWDGRRSDGSYGPGTYRLVGVLASSPRMRTEAEQVCLGKCP